MQRFSQKFSAFVPKRSALNTRVQRFATEAQSDAKPVAAVPTKDLYSQQFQERFKSILNFNSEGKVTEAVEAYENLKKNHLHEMDLVSYNKILASFAPSKLLFRWFKPYKDYNDMYFEAGKFRQQERIDEARLVLEDIERSPLNLTPNVLSYNTFMKVQLSCGPAEVFKVFNTFNQIQASDLKPSIVTFATIMRACSLLERDDVAEELYVYLLTQLSKTRVNNNDNSFLTSQDISIHFFNTMLDCYAEARNQFAFFYFHQMLEKKLPVNGMSFNAYAKACIFMDERHRLAEVPELMRVHGVLNNELSEPVRQEINKAYEQYSVKHYKKSADYAFYKNHTDQSIRAQYQDPFEAIRSYPVWGRRVDYGDYKFMKLLKPYLDKYALDIDKVLTLRLPSSHSTKQPNEVHNVEIFGQSNLNTRYE